MSTSAPTSRNTTTVKNITTPNRNIKTFDGQNYAVWAIHMKDILRERKLLKYLDETDGDAEYQKEDDLNAMAEIRFTLSDKQVQNTLQCETAHEIWEKLKANHLYSSESNLIFLKKQLLDMQMKSNESIQDFVTRINTMAEQIMSLSEEKVSNLDKSLILTRGVPEKFRMVIIALQEVNQRADYEHVATSLTNEEMRLNERKKGNGDQDSENAFYSNSRGNGRGRGGNRGNRGNRGGSTNRFEGNCRYCGIIGHKEFECRKKQFNEQGNHNNYNNNGNRGNYNNYNNYGNNGNRGNFNRGNYRGNYHNYGNHQNHRNNNQANISE